MVLAVFQKNHYKTVGAAQGGGGTGLWFGHSCSKGCSGCPEDTVALEAFSVGCCFSGNTFLTWRFVTEFLLFTAASLSPSLQFHRPSGSSQAAPSAAPGPPHTCSYCLRVCALSVISCRYPCWLCPLPLTLVDKTAVQVISSLLAPALK